MFNLGRCTIVDFHGNCLLDVYAHPGEPIVNYRYKYSGLRPADFTFALPFGAAQKLVQSHIQVCVVIVSVMSEK